MSIDSDQFAARFAALRQRFAGRLLEYAERLDELLAACPDSHDDICDLVHRISGTAGSFGFSDVSRAAGALDEILASGSEPCGHRQELAALSTLMRAQAS